MERPGGFAEGELKSLAGMYMPCDSPAATKLPRQIRDRCENLGVLSIRGVRMDEEQEREVSREIERERQVQKHPPKALRRNASFIQMSVFARRGVIPSLSSTKAFRPVFAPDITPPCSGPYTWSPYILATTDFRETVRASETFQGRMNDYMRLVQWVISGKMDGRDVLFLISPFEADLLMPEIRASKHVRLHLYVPRTAKRMKPADDLRLYSVPPLPSDWTPPWTLIDQLNIFAGQLYLSDYAFYVRVCHFLGVHTDDRPQNAGTVVARNWFSNPDAFGDAEIRNRFEGTPLPLAMQMLVARRGMQLGGTHMGKILDGLPLTKADFETPSSWAKPLAFDGLDKQCGASA